MHSYTKLPANSDHEEKLEPVSFKKICTHTALWIMMGFPMTSVAVERVFSNAGETACIMIGRGL